MATAEVLPIQIVANDNSASAWKSFVGNANQAKSAVEQLNSALGGMGSTGSASLGNLGRVAQLARNPYVLLATAVAAVGIAGASSHTKMEALGDAVSKTGLQAREIDGLGAAIRKAGGDADKAAPALINLQESLNKTSRDGGFLEDLFKLNGSNLNDAAGKVKPVKDAYAELAGFIQNARNNTERLEIATNAYGADAAPSMVKAIMAGADSLEKFNSGAALDPAIRQAQEFDRLWKEITKSSDGLASAIRNLVLPVMSEVYNRVLQIAAFAGSKSAAESRYLLNTPNASRLMQDQNDIDRFYNGVIGDRNSTKTPSNRKEDSFAKNEFDRAVNSIGKHIALMEADAAAVGKTAGEHEQLRVQAQLLDAAQRAGIDVTGKQKEQFDKLALAAKAAADALAVAKLQNDLMFERDQFGRSPTEQIVSSRLRSSGIDPLSDQGQMLAQQIRINEALKSTQEIGAEALKGLVADLRAGKTAGEAFANVLDRIASRLLDKALDNAISGLMGGGRSFLSGIFSGAGASPADNLAAGIIPMHTGGIAGSESGGSMRYVHPAHFNDAPRFHNGLMPDEFPAILQKGEGVFTRGQMAALGGGSAPRINVTVVNNAGAQVGVGEAKSDGNGGFNLEVVVDKMTAKNVSRPGSASNRAVGQFGALVGR